MDQNAFLTSLIGLPYQIGASGPDAFDCYGLARHIQGALNAVTMPEIPLREPTTREIAKAMLAHPERKVWDEVSHPERLDLVLMGNVLKRDFHLGVFVVPATVGMIVHTTQESGVVAADLMSLRMAGFNHLTFYRRRRHAG